MFYNRSFINPLLSISINEIVFQHPSQSHVNTTTSRRTVNLEARNCLIASTRIESKMQYNNRLRKTNRTIRTISNQKVLIFLCLSVAITTSLMSTTTVGFAASTNKTLMQPLGTQGMTTANTKIGRAHV